MKRLKNIFIIGGISILPTLIIFFNVHFNCIIKKITGFNCPSCGVSRSLKYLLQLDLKKSIYYNILTIPLIFLSLYIIINLIYDTINNSNNFIKKMDNFFSKHYIIIIIILIITAIINNIHHI